MGPLLACCIVLATEGGRGAGDEYKGEKIQNDSQLLLVRLEHELLASTRYVVHARKSIPKPKETL